uniref:Kelch like family member 26 n=1 Tax=Leptobrachium leishanense TaxID=445787 RepID=A0A8C5M1D9_9ANUR
MLTFRQVAGWVMAAAAVSLSLVTGAKPRNMAESGGGEFISARQSSMADKSSIMKCTFSAPGHSTTLLQGLTTLRAQGQLLDVILTLNNEVFQVHKVVLAACSDYFRCSFSSLK